MVKNKLESTLDDLEDTLDREKKQRGDTEKQRRKVEADLKISQDMVGELERGKKELDAVVSRRDREILEIAAKLEEEQAGAAKQQRHIKELNSNLFFRCIKLTKMVYTWVQKCKTVLKRGPEVPNMAN